MDTDSEYKVLSETSEQINQSDSKANGKAYLYTERRPCESCDGVIKQFQEKYPDIALDVFWDHPYP